MAMANPDINQCYTTLGIGPDALLEEIQQAHRDLVKVWHPDRFHDSPRLQQKAQEMMKNINIAYETLMMLYVAKKAEPSRNQGSRPGVPPNIGKCSICGGPVSFGHACPSCSNRENGKTASDQDSEDSRF